MEAVDEDNVHLTWGANKIAAKSLFNRLMEFRKGDRRTPKMERSRLLA
jgi:hypothetical protein